MKVIKVDKFEVFDELYKKYEEKKDTNDFKNLIMLFTGNNDPETNKSWCPDCVLAKPVIDETLKKFEHNEQIALVVVEVGLRDVWKTPENPYRNHQVKITCIPTLISLYNVSINDMNRF